jgi:hypothetical protein
VLGTLVIWLDEVTIPEKLFEEECLRISIIGGWRLPAKP